MRKSDLINNISEKTGIPKVDVLVTVETLIKEIKENMNLDFRHKLWLMEKTEEVR